MLSNSSTVLLLPKCFSKHLDSITTIEEINEIGKCLLTLKRLDTSTSTPFFRKEEILPFVNSSDGNLEDMKKTLPFLISEYKEHVWANYDEFDTYPIFLDTYGIIHQTQDQHLLRTSTSTTPITTTTPAPDKLDPWYRV